MSPFPNTERSQPQYSLKAIFGGVFPVSPPNPCCTSPFQFPIHTSILRFCPQYVLLWMILAMSIPMSIGSKQQQHLTQAYREQSSSYGWTSEDSNCPTSDSYQIPAANSSYNSSGMRFVFFLLPVHLADKSTPTFFSHCLQQLTTAQLQQHTNLPAIISQLWVFRSIDSGCIWDLSTIRFKY